MKIVEKIDDFECKVWEFVNDDDTIFVTLTEEDIENYANVMLSQYNANMISFVSFYGGVLSEIFGEEFYSKGFKNWQEVSESNELDEFFEEVKEICKSEFILNLE